MMRFFMSSALFITATVIITGHLTHAENVQLQCTCESTSDSDVQNVNFSLSTTTASSSGCTGSLAHGSQPDPQRYTTTTAYNYRFLLPLVPHEDAFDLRVSFTARANNDVHIALALDARPHSEQTGALYEIVIGGWGNTQSVIRRCKQCTNLATFRHRPLSNTEMRPFLITYENGLVSVFEGDNSEPFMSHRDPEPLSIGAVGFSTGWGSTGEFVFNTCDMY